MSQPAWSRELYELQHQIWPAWSASDGGASAAMAFLVDWLALPPGARVLDLGCGVGRELVALARLGMQVSGVDLSADLVARAQARLSAAELAGKVEPGDLLEPSLDGPFELILLWDSTLNIFPLARAREALAAWLPRLAPGGRVCIQQLHDRFWSGGRGPFVLEGESVGPGRTTRSYRFEDGRLFDEVRYEPPEGPARELPTQELYLYPVEQLEATLRELGLGGVRSTGSKGYAWDAPQPPGPESAMVVSVGELS